MARGARAARNTVTNTRRAIFGSDSLLSAGSWITCAFQSVIVGLVPFTVQHAIFCNNLKNLSPKVQLKLTKFTSKINQIISLVVQDFRRSVAMHVL
jgi:hypothetical protein